MGKALDWAVGVVAFEAGWVLVRAWVLEMLSAARSMVSVADAFVLRCGVSVGAGGRGVAFLASAAGVAGEVVAADADAAGDGFVGVAMRRVTESSALFAASVAGEVVAADADAAGGESVGVAVRRAMESSALFAASVAGDAGERSAGVVKLPVSLPVAVGRGVLALVANARVSVVGREAVTAADGLSSSDITPAVNEAIAMTTKSVLKTNRRFLRLRVWCRYILLVFV